MIEMLEMMWVFTPFEIKIILGAGIIFMVYFILTDKEKENV